MKKQLALIMTLCLLAGTILTNSVKAVERTNGITMPVEQFVHDYTGEKSKDILSYNDNLFQSALLSINEIEYKDETHELSFVAAVNVDEISFEVKGELLNSYKQKKGINSVVGKMKSSCEEVDILHFEIYNDNNTDLFYAREEYKNRPHIKLYFTTDGQLYLFETAIPEELKEIIIPQTEENQCDNMLYDGFWFANIVQADVTVTEEGGTRGTNGEQYCYFDYLYTVSASQYHQYCTVKATWAIANVTANSTIHGLQESRLLMLIV